MLILKIKDLHRASRGANLLLKAAVSKAHGSF
jgi:hypothetical protein